MTTEIKLDDKGLSLENLQLEDANQENDSIKKEKEDKPRPEDKEKYFTLFNRFLHLTSENPVYKPGDRFYQECFSKANLDSLNKLIEIVTPKSIIDFIIKVKKDGTSIHPESLVFALALCATSTDRPALQAEAYKALKAVCSEPQEFFLFMKFLKQLNSPHNLGGRGWKKAVSNWYHVWMPFDLVQIITQHRSHYGWSHKDVLRLAHTQPNNPHKKMLITYAVKGLEFTKKEFENSDDEFIKKSLDHLTKWRNFVNETNMTVAATKIEEELYPLELIPEFMLKNQQIWNALLPRLEIKELVRVLPRIAAEGFLRNNCQTVQIFTDALENYYSKQNCDLHPSEVFIALRTYENRPKLCLEIAEKLKPVPLPTGVPKNPPKVNNLIVLALTSLYTDLFLMLKPTNKKYLIALDCRLKLAQRRCCHCRYLTTLEAAQVITKTISSAEPEENVTVVGFGEKGNVSTLPIKKEMKLKEYCTVIKEVDGIPPPDLCKAVTYASKTQMNVDVFIVISDRFSCTGGLQNALNNYRTEMNQPEAKLLVCSLDGKLKNTKDLNEGGILCIYGFNNKVCRVIEEFCLGVF